MAADARPRQSDERLTSLSGSAKLAAIDGRRAINPVTGVVRGSGDRPDRLLRHPAPVDQSAVANPRKCIKILLALEKKAGY
jgi:hypothetical protein